MEILEIIGVPYFKKGKGIHIKKKNRGKFTEYCGGKVTEECIKRAKKSKNPTLRKRATFADNARKWKHAEGGIIKAQLGTMFLTPHPLSPVGIAVNQAKANAKNKKDQTHLPPGVKEVIGPDGKKIAIRTEQPLKPLEQGIAEWLPGVSDIAEFGYVTNDIKNGNYGTAALAAGLMILPGNARKILDKFGVDLSDIKSFSKLSDEQWDALYFEAIDSGDMDLVLKIKDAHLKLDIDVLLDDKGNPLKLYRGDYNGVNPRSGSYVYYKDPNTGYEIKINNSSLKAGQHNEGVYLNTDREYALQYAGMKNAVNTPQNFVAVADEGALGEYVVKARSVTPVTYPLHYTDIKNVYWGDIQRTKPYDVLKGGVKKYDVPGWRNSTGDTYVVRDPRNVKLNDAITYDDNGKIIPLSKRHNFEINDVRFGITPFILGLGAAKAVSGNSTKNSKNETY